MQLAQKTYFKKFDNSQMSKYNGKSQNARITEASKNSFLSLSRQAEIYGNLRRRPTASSGKFQNEEV